MYAYTYYLQTETVYFLRRDVASKNENTRTYVQSWLKLTK